MRKLLALAAFTLLSLPAAAADSTVTALTAASALGGTELVYCVQSSADRKCSMSQIQTYTLSGVNATTLTALGFAPSVSGGFVAYNGAGGTPSSITLTNGTNLPVTGINATGTPSSTTYLRGDGTWNTPPGGSATPGGTTGAVQYNNAGAFGGLNGTGFVYANGASAPTVTTAVTSVATSCGVGGGTITGTGTISSNLTQNLVSTATPALDGYCGQQVNLSYSAGAKTPTLAATATNGAGWWSIVCNIAANAATLTPASGTIGGAATYVLAAGTAAAPSCVQIAADVTNTDYKLSFVPSTGGGISNAAYSIGTSAPAFSASNQIAFFATAFPSSISTNVVGMIGGGMAGTYPSLSTAGQWAIFGDTANGLVLQGAIGSNNRNITFVYNNGGAGALAGYFYLNDFHAGGDLFGSAVRAGGYFGSTLNNNPLIYMSGPTISSGFNATSPTVTGGSTLAFKVLTGTGTATSSGVIAMGTAAGNGWNCHVTNLTNPTTRTTVMTAHSTTTVTVTNYDHSATTWVATNFGANDELDFVCGAY